MAGKVRGGEGERCRFCGGCPVRTFEAVGAETLDAGGRLRRLREYRELLRAELERTEAAIAEAEQGEKP